MGSAVLVVVGLVLDVDLCVDVTLIRFTIAILFNVDSGLSGRTRRAIFFVDLDFLLSAYRLTVAVLFGYFDLLFKAAGRSGLG